MDFVQVQWKSDGQNSIVMECMKSPAPYFWPILHSRDKIPLRTPKIWWEMSAKYG